MVVHPAGGLYLVGALSSAITVTVLLLMRLGSYFLVGRAIVFNRAIRWAVLIGYCPV